MAPEVRALAESDIHAFGVLLYSLLTVKVFDNESFDYTAGFFREEIAKTSMASDREFVEFVLRVLSETPGERLGTKELVEFGVSYKQRVAQEVSGVRFPEGTFPKPME
ncbi:hypothetical protein K470DRAFT_263658 [Piedraia hortae CBS 480.64]|uniref:Protein kinase domain-containing protein n=1 Tax=Piedraia hortae CBS 480.64 TaxID=1314780 RepID=A0A6A7C2D0_9PEZI|nr:hypothetical protein K470DRAFT_263658 [Piedraia hortae CBS 480.64]